MRWSIAVLAAAAALAGCTDGDGSTAEPTVPTAPSTSSTLGAVDVSVIPETIDEPYLNAVLAALDEIDGQATRLIVASKTLKPQAVDLLNAIYSDSELKNQTDVWLASIGNDPDLRGIRRSPGNRKTSVTQIIAASRACVWIAVDRDYSAVNIDPGPDRTEYLALEPLDGSNDPRNTNPTAWMITADGHRQDQAEPSNPCPTA